MKNHDLSELSSYLFWDRNINKLDITKDRYLILERVFTRGMENDERLVFALYDEEVIKSSIIEIKHLDKKTLNYLSIIFNIPQEKFRCYKNIQFQNHY